MNRVVLQASKSISVSALIALTLWLNGLGCSLCCATGASNVSALMTSACVTPDCCRHAQPNSTPTSTESISGTTTIGCSLLPSQEPATMPHVPDDQTDAPAVAATFVATFHDYIQPVYTLNDPLPLNRGGTYLRCCVLLI
jgi:hypothetical protein